MVPAAPPPSQERPALDCNERSALLAPSRGSDKWLLPPDGVPAQHSPMRVMGVASLGATLILALVFGMGLKIRTLGSPKPPPTSALMGTGPSVRLVVRPVQTADPTRPGFASRLDSNLILHDDFDSADSLLRPWRPDATLYGDGNGCFEHYTSNSANVAVEDGELRIRPGLFANLGRLRTAGAGNNRTYDAADVMVGNCEPFPECATFDLGDSCTIPDFAGCRRIGTPLVALNPATSGRVSTKGRFDFTYGRLEARIRLPRGDWLWPALWLYPTEEAYGPWPDSGEVDIMEARGNDHGYVVAEGRHGGRDLFESCLHYAGNAWWHTKTPAWASEVLGCTAGEGAGAEECDLSKDFFTVGLYWSDVRMYSYVLRDNREHILWDVNASMGFGPYDVPLGSLVPPLARERDKHDMTPVEGAGQYARASKNRNAPFDRPAFIILNLAVGGEQNGCPDPGYWGKNAVWCTDRDPSRPEVTASTVFWNARNKWLPTWEAARAEGREAFAVDWVKVWQ